jgi:hypothetical protein
MAGAGPEPAGVFNQAGVFNRGGVFNRIFNWTIPGKRVLNPPRYPIDNPFIRAAAVTPGPPDPYARIRTGSRAMTRPMISALPPAAAAGRRARAVAFARALPTAAPDLHRMAWQALAILLLGAALLLADAARADSRLLDQARRGDAAAAELLAAQYETGSGMRQSYSEAAYWYGRAADAGRRAAQFAYGQFLETGTGLVKDETQAARWYLMAARQGHAGAAVNLAGQLATGRGVQHDPLAAYRLLLAAKGFRGQDSIQAAVEANLAAVGKALTGSQRSGAMPLDLAHFELAGAAPHSAVAARPAH